MPPKVAAIGECMAEIRKCANDQPRLPGETQPQGSGRRAAPSHARHPPGRPGRRQQADGTFPAQIAYGGDTLNFAVYLARQGIPIDYATALGDDPLSDWMLAQWRAEGVGCGLVRREAGALPGLYLIDLDASGERSFRYWRQGSPASRLLDDQAQARQLFGQLANFEWLYLTGITLAICAPPSRARLFDFLAAHRVAGGQIAFDSNFRPKLWPNREQAASACERLYRCADLALSTWEDERQLFGDASEREAANRLGAWGVPEIVLKKGSSGCAIATGATLLTVPSPKPAAVADTTAAGDSFNAGYLAARLNGRTARDAAMQGNQLASLVVQHPGAIIPQEAMAAPPKSGL